MADYSAWLEAWLAGTEDEFPWDTDDGGGSNPPPWWAEYVDDDYDDDDERLIDTAQTDEDNPVSIDVLAPWRGHDDDDPKIIYRFDSLSEKGGEIRQENGQLVYDPGFAFDYLAAGEKATDRFFYVIAEQDDDEIDDPVGTWVTVTVTGVNDAPVIEDDGSTFTGAVTEDATQPALLDSGTIEFSDADLTDVHTASAAFKETTHTAQLGTLAASVVSDTTGTGTGGVVEWDYSVHNSATQFLANGQSITETYVVTLTDNQGSSVTREVAVTITGVNDDVVIGAAVLSGAVTEDAAQPALLDSGTIEFSDVDLADVHTASAAFKETTHTARLGTLAASVVADTTGVGTGGVVEWDYSVLNSATQFLGRGQSITETYTVTLTDNQGSTVTRDVAVKINGVNDVSLIVSEDLAGAVTEGDSTANLTDTGSLDFEDADLTDTHIASASFRSTTHTQQLGSMTASVTTDTTGTGLGGVVTWDYVVNDSLVQFLAQGETIDETYTVALDDGNGGIVTRDVVATITGTNDRPVAQDIAFSIGEDDNSVVKRSFDADDVDANEAQFLSYDIVSNPARGSVVNNNDGTFTFLPGDDFQYLNSGQQTDVSFEYTANDGSGAPNAISERKTVTVTVIGDDDAPIDLSELLSFTSTDQSMWATGDAFVLDPVLPFIGLQWDISQDFELYEGGSFLGIDVPSAVLSASTDGQIGLQPYFGVTSGDVNTVLKGKLGFKVPKQVIPGQEITIKSGFMLEDGEFTTVSPNITLGLDLIVDFNASAEVTLDYGASAATEQIALIDKGVGIEERFEVPVNGGGNGGGDSQSFDLFDPIDINQIVEIFSFSGEDARFEFEFEDPTTGNSLGSFEGGFPVIETTSQRVGDSDVFVSSGVSEEPILAATADLDGLASLLIPLPPFSIDASASIIEIGDSDDPTNILGIEAGIDLLDVDLTAALFAAQDFRLSLGELTGVLTLEDGTAIDYTVGDDITFTVPDTFDFDNDGALDLIADVNVNGDPNNEAVGALFENLTTLNFELGLGLEAFSANVDITSDLFDDFSLAEFGPLFETEVDLIKADAFATIFDDEFALIGFNTGTAEFGIDASLENFLA